jgi:L-alanine-DL-glutamate epimerase-like enolase superfamily enzyme
MAWPRQPSKRLCGICTPGKQASRCHQLLGGSRRSIDCGVSIGIQDTVGELLKKIEKEVTAGYQRIKIKIKPGWDLDVAA